MSSKQRQTRKTFATPTLIKINSRLGYYRRVLATEPITPKQQLQHQRIKNKYNQCMKVRQLLNRAVRNLYL